MEERIYRTYNVTDRRIADELIKLNKYMYFIEELPHWRTGMPCKTWCFEMIMPAIKEDIAEIKARIFNKKC